MERRWGWFPLPVPPPTPRDCGNREPGTAGHPKLGYRGRRRLASAYSFQLRRCCSRPQRRARRVLRRRASPGSPRLSCAGLRHVRGSGAARAAFGLRRAPERCAVRGFRTPAPPRPALPGRGAGPPLAAIGEFDLDVVEAGGCAVLDGHDDLLVAACSGDVRAPHADSAPLPAPRHRSRRSTACSRVRVSSARSSGTPA